MAQRFDERIIRFRQGFALRPALDVAPPRM
jgi:hypothetical protein